MAQDADSVRVDQRVRAVVLAEVVDHAAVALEDHLVRHLLPAGPDVVRDLMVQAWYQGGISVFDFTDSAHPQEIAFFAERTDVALADGAPA